MNERIKKLTEKTLNDEMYVYSTKTDYDRTDIFLSPVKMSGKRVCEYILNQEPLILEESAFTGVLRFDDSVEGDIFHCLGHKHHDEAYNLFYNKPLDNLITYEWQHSTADFSRVINNGLCKIKENIEESKIRHIEDSEAVEFLETQTDFCNAVIGWAHKCSELTLKKAEETKNEEYRSNLLRLAAALKRVPEFPAESFYEAVLSLYLCHSFVPDSIGTIDRYLYPYYKNDIENNVMTEEEAKAYLQELFLMTQARKLHSVSTSMFTRGGECHFCVGGYLPSGEDGFNDFSKLIIDALMELPTYTPQISLRWTKKLPREIFKYVMDCERRDPIKRIAFVNDEPRIKGIMERLGLTFEQACSYCMTGCNETSFPGGQEQNQNKINIAHPLQTVFYNRTEDILNAESFEDFYSVFEQELTADVKKAIEIGTEFQKKRAEDINIVSNIFFAGPIEKAMSMTKKGALDIAVGSADFIGFATVIDSLSITKQFVYDEKLITMETLVEALHSNWKGFEDLHTMIMKKGRCFGNDDATSNEVALKFTESIYKILDSKENYWGKKLICGDLVGYNQHYTFFGSEMNATPDGRYDKEPIQFGCQQSNGRDMNGLTALLNSIAKSDPKCLFVGSTVTNVTIDEKLVMDDEYFEKTVQMFETYFKNGGIHFQLSYVSADDLKKAKENPQKYKNLRVRVSGFSEYFVNLNEDLQADILSRTLHVM